MYRIRLKLNFIWRTGMKVFVASPSAPRDKDSLL